MPSHKSTPTKPKTKSSRSGIILPVGRVHRNLKEGEYARRIGGVTAVYLAAVLEYLASEILDLASKAAEDNKRLTILPRHIMLAIRHDEELDKLLSDVIITRAGVMPKIEPQLLPKKTYKNHSQKIASQEY